MARRQRENIFFIGDVEVAGAKDVVKARRVSFFAGDSDLRLVSDIGWDASALESPSDVVGFEVTAFC